MKNWLKGLIDVREGERATTAAMFVYILLIIAVLVIVKSVRESLFLQNFGAASKPYVYLLIAGVAGGIAALYQRYSRNRPIHRLIVGTMLVIIANLVLFRFLFLLQWDPLPYVLYVWVAVYGILATAQFWMLANYVYDPRQAKRLFALLGLGATIGGIAGGYITNIGARLIGTENLLVFAGALLGGCALIAIYLARSQGDTIREAARANRFKTSVAEKTAGGFRLIWESRYLKLVMAVIALSIIIATVVDNQFSYVVQEHFPGKDEKTVFFGQFYTWLGWSAFLTQFLLTGRLLRRFGVGVTMRVLPVAFFFGSGLFVLMPMLATGVLMKIADGSFRYTTHKASLELLYLPVSIGVKNKTKAFMDMFTDRFSKGIAALLVLLMTTVLGLHYTKLSWVLMGLSVLWIGVTVLARREYVAAFRDSLLRRRLDEDQLIISQTDAATVGALGEALARATSPQAARSALNLVAGVKSPVLTEPLARLSHADDPEIARLALDRLAEQDDPATGDLVSDLMDHTDIEVVSRVLRLRCTETDGLSPVRLAAFLADDRPAVRVGAIMCSLRWGDVDTSQAIDADTLENFLADSGADQRQTERLLASLLRVLPAGELAQTYIERFLASDDPVVCSEAIAAAGRLQPRELVEPLIRSLGNRNLRHRVRDALAAYGETALGTLEDYFRDTRTDRAARRYMPRVFERIPVQRSVDLLVAGLDDADERVRFGSLRSLGRLRVRNPGLDFSHDTLTRRLEEEIRKAYRYQGWLLETGDGEETFLLRKTLEEKAQKTIDRMFRLLAMKHPPVEVYAASRALASPNARIRANAIEYLDNVVVSAQKKRVLGLVEDKPTHDHVRHMLAEVGEPSPTGSAALEAQARAIDDWHAACALYTVWATREETLYHLIEEPTSGAEARPLVEETVASLRHKLKARSH